MTNDGERKWQISQKPKLLGQQSECESARFSIDHRTMVFEILGRHEYKEGSLLLTVEHNSVNGKLTVVTSLQRCIFCK